MEIFLNLRIDPATFLFMTLIKHVEGFLEHVTSLRVFIDHIRDLSLHPVNAVSIGSLSP